VREPALAEVLREAMAARWLARVRRTARPLTPDEWAARTLVVAPHPDDETLAVGGVVAQKRARGVDVAVVFLTSGDAGQGGTDPVALAEQRRDEGRAAAAELGVPAGALTFCDLPDGKLARHFDAAVARVRAVMEGFRPTLVLAPTTPDGHSDHEAAALIARRARADARDVAARLFEYPVWLWRHFPWVPRERPRPGSAFRPVPWGGLRLVRQFDRVAPVPPEVIAQKLGALRRHQSQVGADGRGGIAAIAQGAWLRRLMADIELLREI